MRIRFLLLLICLFPLLSAHAQSTAWKRSNAIGKGMNLSWMDQRWNGTEEEEHRDYLDTDQLPYIKKQIALMHDLGFQLLRFPVCFDLWYDSDPPYKLVKPEYYPALDSVIRWTAEKNMRLIIDNHHGILTPDHTAENTKRIAALWTDVARRYKNSDAERIFFEVFNEPNLISKEDWERSAKEIVSAIRKQAPHHTLLVGATEWNGLNALKNMSILSDTNILYTFHFYDPFLYTHQGADWAGDAATTTGIPYPYRIKDMPVIDSKAAGTWAEEVFRQYPQDANYQSLEVKLKSIQEWSRKNNVPIFCGEWGAYKNYSAIPDRCTYLHDVYTILQQLHIPNAMWEWDAGFSFFDHTPSKQNITPCMKGIVEGK